MTRKKGAILRRLTRIEKVSKQSALRYVCKQFYLLIPTTMEDEFRAPILTPLGWRLEKQTHMARGQQLQYTPYFRHSYLAITFCNSSAV